jgi:hypothetical protein
VGAGHDAVKVWGKAEQLPDQVFLAVDVVSLDLQADLANDGFAPESSEETGLGIAGHDCDLPKGVNEHPSLDRLGYLKFTWRPVKP